METLLRLFDNLRFVAIFLSILLLVLAELGFRAGLRIYRTKDEARRSLISGVQGATLGLLALLLGFTFAMAVNRYETKRDLVLKEANAIGTTFLRAGLLPEASRAPVKELLLRYLDMRIQYYYLAGDREKLLEGIRRSTEIENALWGHVETAAVEAPTPITATFILSLNEMIDTDAERIATFYNRIPLGVWLLLYIVAGFGCFTTGYTGGTRGARSAFNSALVPMLIAVVILLIFDLMHARQGIIGISQQPLSDLRASLSNTSR
jgi:hypothetical protein